MKTLTIGIMPQAQVRARAIAIARGEYERQRGEPKVWFPSMRSVAGVLSDENRRLLQIAREKRPASLRELAKLTGRKPGDLSRRMRQMSCYGLVELKRAEGREVQPIVGIQAVRILAGS